MATNTIAESDVSPSTSSYHAAATRRHLLDFDLDEPPSYNDTEETPAYTREAPRAEGQQLDGSALVYSLRQLSRKRQAFVSMGPPLNIVRENDPSADIDTSINPERLDSDLALLRTSTDREFIIEHKTGAGFSKVKPDFVILTADREQKTALVPPVRRRLSIFGRTSTGDASPEQRDIRRGSLSVPGEAVAQTLPIASVRFARSGPLPWTPRATVIYEPAFVKLFSYERHDLNETRKQEMSLRRADANGWTTTILDRDYIWCLLASPNRLGLIEMESGDEKASFIYSEVGTFSDKGGEIGRLSVPLQSIPTSTDPEAGGSGFQYGFMEHVVCSLSAAVVHWRNEGKAIYNAGRSRPPDIVGDRMPLGSATAL